jgi:cellulose synthase/poly-beta-1,6-N-acetylglucosamine synthase-like glycosyltransferase
VDLIFVKQTAGAVERGQGAYWRYESFLRRCGAIVRTNVVVSGTCYAMRKDLFAEVPANIGDDLASPLAVTRAGRRVVFDPTIAVEEVSNVSHEGETRMRRRVALQNVAALPTYWKLLHPKYGFAAYQLFAHKYLRALCWVPMLIALGVSLYLSRQPVYAMASVAQLAFYFLAAVGFWRHRRGEPAGLAYVPYYFSLLNIAYLIAFLQFLAGERRATWEPERRG